MKIDKENKITNYSNCHSNEALKYVGFRLYDFMYATSLWTLAGIQNGSKWEL